MALRFAVLIAACVQLSLAHSTYLDPYPLGLPFAHSTGLGHFPLPGGSATPFASEYPLPTVQPPNYYDFSGPGAAPYTSGNFAPGCAGGFYGSNYGSAAWATPAAAASPATAWKTPAALPAFTATGIPPWSAPGLESAWTTPAAAPATYYTPTAPWDAPSHEYSWNSPAYLAGTPATATHAWSTPATPAGVVLPGTAHHAAPTPAPLLAAPGAPAVTNCWYR